MRLQERLNRRFLTSRARLPPSLSKAPANNELTKPTPDGK